MNVIDLWRCPVCGWTRSGTYGGRCRNAFSDECVRTPPFSRIRRVRYVPLEDVLQIAQDVLSLADDAGMPDSYKETDARMVRARAVLDQEEQ